VGSVLLALWIGKGESIMSFWRLAWRNLTLRKVRTGLTIFSIAVAVAVLYTLLS